MTQFEPDHVPPQTVLTQRPLAVLHKHHTDHGLRGGLPRSLGHCILISPRRCSMDRLVPGELLDRRRP